MDSTMTFSEEKFKQGTSYLMPFEKMHGLGNDFIVINSMHLPEDSNQDYEQALCKRICNRHKGIGADGIIIIDQVKESTEAIRSWRYYNSDGSVAEMCGNGIRCAAKYIYEHGLSGEDINFKIETLAGDIGIEMQDQEMVKVDMGAPKEIKNNLKLSVNNFSFDYEYVSMGNPHAISFFNDIQRVKNHGPAIETHSAFPNKTNVEFAQLVSETEIDLIVWERGCGFTEACGTGACATVVAAVEKGYAKKDTDIKVNLPGGTLIINWDSITGSIFMTGKAEMTFIGYYNS
jgi:diaminopimelate epimerase